MAACSAGYPTLMRMLEAALCGSCEAVVKKARRCSHASEPEVLYTQMSWLLIVEEHALFGEGLALLLEWRTGLDSIQTGSIAEAQRILEEAPQSPACAIVDLDLPDGDGIELLERLRGLPVVALVSDRSLERYVRALEAGVDEVLNKGESTEKIQTAVERLVGGVRTRDFFSD